MREMIGTLASKNAVFAFFVPKTKRSGVATGRSDSRSIEWFAPRAVRTLQISRRGSGLLIYLVMFFFPLAQFLLGSRD